MPAVSKKQQQFFGIVHGLQKGTVKPSDVTKKAKDVAKSIDPEDAKKFAKTKHKGLPDKVEKEIKEMIRKIVREEVLKDWRDKDVGDKRFVAVRDFLFYSGRPAGWAQEDYENGAYDKEYNKKTEEFIKLVGSLDKAFQIAKFIKKQ